MINHEITYKPNQIYSFKSHGCYKVSKIKEAHSDCQDACSLGDERRRVAISDGATQSFYSGLWAQILCDLYCSWPNLITHKCWTDWKNAAQSKWFEQVENKLDELKKAGKPSWIECLNGIKLKKEAFATFIGISLEGAYLNGICIGDSCAFLIKLMPINPEKEGGQGTPSIARIFPGLWRHSFESRTAGLSSYDNELNQLPEFFNIPVPTDKEDHRILLMTDALAQYVLDMEQKGMPVISDLLSIETQDEYARYVDQCRKTGLANDDTTLIIIEITDDTKHSKANSGQQSDQVADTLATNIQKGEEEFAFTMKNHARDQSLLPSADVQQLALPPSLDSPTNTESITNHIKNKKEASTSLPQANNSTLHTCQELQYVNDASDQETTDEKYLKNRSSAKHADSELGKHISSPESIVSLPPLPGKKNWNNHHGSQREMLRHLRGLFRNIRRCFRSES